MSNQPLRILVVDDEKDLCELACAWLEGLGHTVSVAHSGAAGLQALSGQQFDLLFTDVIMPGGMNGLALAKQACVQQPGLRVVLASGYAEGLLEQGHSDWPFLDKPYRKADLIKVLETIT